MITKIDQIIIQMHDAVDLQSGWKSIDVCNHFDQRLR